MVTEFNMKNNSFQIQKLIQMLSNEFTSLRDSDKRKGGLIELADSSLGLGKDSSKYVSELVSPILNCLNDHNLRVRYFASLYIVVARCSIIPFFLDLFAALFRLAADSNQMVEDGNELLKRFLKDMVTESSQSRSFYTS